MHVCRLDQCALALVSCWASSYKPGIVEFYGKSRVSSVVAQSRAYDVFFFIFLLILCAVVVVVCGIVLLHHLLQWDPCECVWEAGESVSDNNMESFVWLYVHGCVKCSRDKMLTTIPQRQRLSLKSGVVYGLKRLEFK